MVLLASKKGGEMATLIEVINWKKFNPRSDCHTHWFRIEDDLFVNPNFPDLDGEEFKMFIFILCTTCQKQGVMWRFDINRIIKLISIKISSAHSAIRKLQEYSIIRLSNEDVTESIVNVTETGLHNITVHNRTIHNTIVQNLDFGRAYDLYPRKIGKKKGIEYLKRHLKSVADLEKFETAVKNYAAYCDTEKTELQYIKQFSTFCHCWEDWVEKPETREQFEREKMAAMLPFKEDEDVDEAR